MAAPSFCFQNSPDILPVLSTSMRSAAGDFGSPGIVSTSPVSATMKPAPAETLTSRTVTVKSSGAPSFVLSSEKLPRLRDGHGHVRAPSAVAGLSARRPGRTSMSCPVDALHHGAQLVLNAARQDRMQSGNHRAAHTALSTARQAPAPAPPCAHTSLKVASTLSSLGSARAPAQALLRKSVGETVDRNDGRQTGYILHICHVLQQVRQPTLERREIPFRARAGYPSQALPCILSARTVATTTAAEGVSPGEPK